jgi:hypothetical protein
MIIGAEPAMTRSRKAQARQMAGGILVEENVMRNGVPWHDRFKAYDKVFG